jgi:GT2 family glycosyltransferase
MLYDHRPDNMTRGVECAEMAERECELFRTAPPVSLLIPSRNRPQLLQETVDSILAGDEVPAELIIVDQSEIPHPYLGSFRPDRGCEVRYLWINQSGVSLGRNTAAAAATYPILVLTDDDMLVSPTWFGSLVSALVSAGPRAVVTGRVLASDEGDASEGATPSTRTDELTVVYEGRVKRDPLFTNNMAMYRSAFDSVGGFDTRMGPGTPFPAAEDNDFAFRLLEGGYRIIYDPHPTLYHRAWRSNRELLRLYWNYGIGQGAFYAKHAMLSDSFMARRMLDDVLAYSLRLPFRLCRQTSQGLRDGLFVAGLLFGAVRWGLSLRRGSHG